MLVIQLSEMEWLKNILVRKLITGFMFVEIRQLSKEELWLFELK